MFALKLYRAVPYWGSNGEIMSTLIWCLVIRAPAFVYICALRKLTVDKSTCYTRRVYAAVCQNTFIRIRVHRDKIQGIQIYYCIVT